MGKVNFRTIWALLKRDLRRYFTNPSGYVFITLFIFLSAAAAFWTDRFFLRNLANLDSLNEIFPLLLVFFVPALTMAIWSEERKQGTDELLLTLPATDLEVTLGKYLATLGIYSVSLLLSFSHVLVLFWLGKPDVGLMFGNYVGYWLVGAALIAAGMLASMLTANATIAFILGALLCAAVVYIDRYFAIFSEAAGRFLEPLGATGHFGDFARGVVSLSAIAYFVTLTAFLLYLNVALIGRRHWPRMADGLSMNAHHVVRAVALGAVLISVNAMVGRSSARLDVTAERLHSLSDETRQLVAALSPERPVFIQAFISPEVPETYVQTRENLLSILREISAEAGPRVQLLIEDTEPFSAAARDAREKFGIVAQKVPSLSSARASVTDVYLGVAVTCGAGEQVLPFVDRGLPVEYELARSIRVVAQTERKKIGVVNTAVRLFGGMDFQTFRSTPPWSVVEELKKQYEVVQIAANGPITEEVDGLLVVLPSSLPQDEMDNVLTYIESGRPTLLLVDPLPLINMSLAPSERAGADRNPFTSQGQPPPPDKGDIHGFLAQLGIQWNKGQIVWDGYNPHPDLANLPKEVVFVGRGSGVDRPFNPEDRASAGLQELVFLYAGNLQADGTEGITFAPLLHSGRDGGSFDYAQVVQRSFFGSTLNQNLRYVRGDGGFVLAGRVTGTPADPAGDASDPTEATGASKPISVIVIADVDFISEQFFAIRRAGAGNLNFDNVTFFLNSMDTLVGDESFIELRNRRVRHRTLTRVEARTRAFVERRGAQEKQAEDDAARKLEEAQARLDAKVEEVRGRTDLDNRTKEIMVRNLQEVESRRFEVQKSHIETEKQAKLQASQEEMEAEIRQIQSGIRTSAVLLPPIPVFILGVMIFLRRQRREREGAAAAHRLRG